MKKIFSSLLAFCFVLTVATTVFAQEPSSPSPTPKKIRSELKEGKKEGVEKMRQRRAENIRRFFNQMLKRYRAMVERLERLAGRIESRLDKISQENSDKDLSSVKAELERAKVKLADAKNKISEIETLRESLIDSEIPRESFKDIKEKLATIKNDLKGVHKILVRAIGQIKGLKVGETKK